MNKGEERKKKLEDSIQQYSLLRDAHELESWINDKVSYINLPWTPFKNILYFLRLGCIEQSNKSPEMKN